MEHNIDYWLGDTMVLVLIAVAVVGISTSLACLRNLKKSNFDALIYFTLSTFFWALHMIWINYAPPESILFNTTLSLWQWLVYLFSPALIVVFLLHAAYWYAKTGGWPALVRVFCAVTLGCLLYMIGQNWTMEIKGFLALLWVFFLWRVEFPRKAKRPAFIFVTRRLL
ncbi:MAG: hypothetical protein ACREBV_00505 [Candidatus Zixiibacteriota bacterium]